MQNPLAADLEHVLRHTGEVWEDLRGQRIFITGGTGFFGCWLLESLAWANDKLELGCEAVVLTRDTAAFARKAPHLAAHRAIHLHTGDVRSFDFPAGHFTHVIHAATESSTGLGERDPLAMFDSIVTGTRRTLDFAVAAGVRKFLFTSSGAVYGKQPPELAHIPETYAGAPDATEPRSVYGEGKRAAELLCAMYRERHGIEAKIARCFAFVGPYLPLDIHFAVGNFIRDAMEGRAIQVSGDGTPFRSYLYTADLAIWLWTILMRGEPGRAYNVGSAEAVSIAELARAVGKALGARIPARIAGTPQAGVPALRYVPSTARARDELGLEPLIGLMDAIRKTAAWHGATAAVSG